MIRFAILILIFSTLSSCTDSTKTNRLKVGSYRAVLQTMDNEPLPFIFEVESENLLKVYNADEVIVVDEIEYRNDSVFIKAPVFEGYIAAALNGDDLQGRFVKESLDREVPFNAQFDNAERFKIVSEPTQNVTGTWETVFGNTSEGDTYLAKGVFDQIGTKVTGTFLTTTGDYRYLEGVMDGNKMKLSTFDGAHAFLFTAIVSDSAMQGQFYSGNHWKEPFTAIRNSAFELPSADELTFLKPGYTGVDFSFPNVSGEMVSLNDPHYKDKVIIVQIMGTWCPNCLDESKYYAKFYDANKDKGVEIIALAFEYAKTKEKAFESIRRLQERLQISYPILLAQYGTSDKSKAQEKLPMLNHVLSYPTSIFIDKSGKVRKIHTGFNGPATGENYDAFKVEFERFVTELLAESF